MVGSQLGGGVVGVDALTGGEGGETLQVGEGIAKEVLEVTAEDEIKEAAEKSLEDIGKQFEEHHSDPEFMGEIQIKVQLSWKKASIRNFIKT